MMRMLPMLFLLLLMGMNLVDAAVYKGQKAYKIRCKVCHESGNKMALIHTKKEWEKLFFENGVALARQHINNPRVDAYLTKLHEEGQAQKITLQKVNAYFENRAGSEKFEESVRHLRDFFVEYAKDSDSVPACN